MSKVLLAAGAVVCLTAGWIGGSLRPVPSLALTAIDPGGLETRVRSGLAGMNLDAVGRLFTKDQWRAITSAAVQEETAEGRVIAVERVDAATVAEAAKTADTGAAFEPPAATRTFESGAPCPGMRVSNAPAEKTLADVRARQTAARVKVEGVALSLLPAPGACLSSGFGPRGGRTHKGVDFHARTGVPVYASGAGTVREMKYRDDYGNMVLIDHGGGVFTRYAHLAGFDPALKPGARIEAGGKLGLMGNTAAYSIPVHLHYEVLVGDYDTPKQSFGLRAVDPFAQPRA